jgi:Putative Actinobacterial Holin-X, holin superfamily III
MTSDTLGKTGLARSLADVLGDISDLLAKQIQLAKSEVVANIGRGVRAAVWAGAAAFLFLLSAMVAIEALVFGIASAGIALHWACLLVAAVLAVIGAAFLIYARSAAANALVPERSIRQVNKDISVAKEQLK